MRKNKWILIGIVCCMCLAGCAKKDDTSLKEKPIITQGQTKPLLSGEKEEMPTSVPTNGSTKPMTEEKESKKVQEVIQGEAWELGNSQGNLLAQGFVCENQGKIYYKDLNGDEYLCVMNSDGTGKKVIAKDIPGAIQVWGEYIYYIDSNPESVTYHRIKRIKKDGSGGELLGEERAGNMLVTQEGIFYTGENCIGRMQEDGSNVQTVVAGDGKKDYGWLCIYGDSLITGGVLGGINIRSIKIDTGEEHLLFNGYSFPHVEGDKLYCSTQKGDMTEISLITGEQKIWENSYGHRSVICDTKLYYTNGRELLWINGEISEILCGVSEEIKQGAIELYGSAAGCLFFTETEAVDTTGKEYRNVFKFINPVTMEVNVVP